MIDEQQSFDEIEQEGRDAVNAAEMAEANRETPLGEELDGGWPGDGSGTDDLADFNQNEADDYREEDELFFEDDNEFLGDETEVEDTGDPDFFFDEDENDSLPG